jgi:hypothetical protein
MGGCRLSLDIVKHCYKQRNLLNFNVMDDNSSAYRAPGARPVTGLPLDILLGRAGELARRWAIALIRSRSLDNIGGIPLEELAREAPALFSQALRAMQSDAELNRLTGSDTGGGDGAAAASGLAAMAGAHDASTAIEAVEALRGVLWEAMLDELRDPPARLVADIADRLGYVCARALRATLATTSAGRVFSPLRAEARGTDDMAPADVDGRAGHRAGGHAPLIDAVIVDERADGESSAAEPIAPPRHTRREADDVHLPAAERPLSWDESPPVPPAGRAAAIQIRDERAEQGPAAWIGSIGRQLAQFAQDGRSFAVLLVEMSDMDGIRRSESPTELARLDGLAEETLAREVRTRGSGSLTRECPGRYWLLAPDTDRAGAELFAQRVRQSVASSVSYRQAPLDVMVGAAVCPEDGEEGSALAAQADVELYAARAAAAAAHAPGDGNGASSGRRGSLLAGFRPTREGGGG